MPNPQFFSTSASMRVLSMKLRDLAELHVQQFILKDTITGMSPPLESAVEKSALKTVLFRKTEEIDLFDSPDSNETFEEFPGPIGEVPRVSRKRESADKEFVQKRLHPQDYIE